MKIYPGAGEFQQNNLFFNTNILFVQWTVYRIRNTYVYVHLYGNQSHIWIWSCLIKVDHSSVMTIIYLFIHVFYRCSVHTLYGNDIQIDWAFRGKIYFQPHFISMRKNNHLLPLLKMTQHFRRNQEKKAKYVI